MLILDVNVLVVYSWLLIVPFLSLRTYSVKKSVFYITEITYIWSQSDTFYMLSPSPNAGTSGKQWPTNLPWSAKTTKPT